MRAKSISRDVFDEHIDRTLKQKTESHLQYTYIAKAGDADIYKFGMSRNPIRREKELHGVYKGFKVLYFLEANIESAIHLSLFLAGGENAFVGRYGGPREAFFLTQEDAEYIVKHCGFRPIIEFDKPFFDALFQKECEEYYQRVIQSYQINN